MDPFPRFNTSISGHFVCIVVGIVLVVWGLIGLGGTAGIILAVIGAVPLLAGLFDFCVFTPLFGNPLSGSKILAGE
jgi:hypothetical protein